MRTISNFELQYVGGAGTWCGPEGGWFSDLIPDSPLGFPFGEVCKAHDFDFRPGSGVSMEFANQKFLNGLLNVVNGNPIGIVLAYVYYGAVTIFGGTFYQGDMPSDVAPTSHDIDIDMKFEEFTVTQTATDFLTLFGTETSSDVWYDGSEFGDLVCDAYYEMGGGAGLGGNEIPTDAYIPNIVIAPVVLV